VVKEKPKVVVFIDGSNIYFAQKKIGKWLGWREALIKGRKFVRI